VSPSEKPSSNGPRFTLAEANRLLDKVRPITETSLQELERCHDPWQSFGLRKFSVLHEMLEEDVIRTRWAARIARLGAYPKGGFTVDFQSPDPDLVYCWHPGESEITHQHKTWEDFRHRRPVERDDP